MMPPKLAKPLIWTRETLGTTHFAGELFLDPGERDQHVDLTLRSSEPSAPTSLVMQPVHRPSILLPEVLQWFPVVSLLRNDGTILFKWFDSGFRRPLQGHKRRLMTFETIGSWEVVIVPNERLEVHGTNAG